MNDKFFLLVRGATMAMIIFSIALTYYVMVVKKDFEIFTNPEGPDTSDYIAN